jgi:DNA-binding transcriptional ArsR family regulator
MTTSAQFAGFASLFGNRSRADMLIVLMDGRALTASELARAACVAPQTGSGHLDKMVKAGVLKVETQGRHRFYRLASARIAQLIEHMVQAVPPPCGMPVGPFTGPRDPALRLARTCYDHLAGRLGVAIADALIARGHIHLGSDAGLLTASGARLLRRIGMDMCQLEPACVGRGRILCRPCLDWSERRPHLAGVLGSALCSLSLAQNWIRRRPDSRVVTITPMGYRSYDEYFGVRLQSGAVTPHLSADGATERSA